jgi:TATA-box binding protein (TBP) (component of TFIID and TFIIIB)
MMHIKVTNVCFKSNTRCLINIKQIFNDENDGIRKKYNPRTFPGLILYFKYGTCLLFKSGYYSIAGCRLVEDGVKAQLELLDLLRRHNYEVKNVELRITNVCGSFDCEKKINLVKLALAHEGQANYEMELFPAVKFTLDKHVFTVHSSGKVFVTGMRTVPELNDICAKMYNILISYFIEVI